GGDVGLLPCEPQHHLRLAHHRRTTHRFIEPHRSSSTHTLLTTIAKLSHASKSERINRSFEISSTIDPHKHQREGFAHTSPLPSESYTHPPTSEPRNQSRRRKTHDAFTPGDKAGNVGTVGASTFRKLSRRRKAKEAFTNPRKTSCQERSSSRDKTLTQIHQHVGENHKSEPTARRIQRNEKEESHRRRHALRRAAGRRSYLMDNV
ncbi:unnamed protein product, partial [Brassica rapa subsp. trilocularis]